MDVIKAITRYFEEAEIRYFPHEDDREVHAVVCSSSGIHNVIVQQADNLLRVVVLAGPRVPLKARPAVAELLARATLTMEMGRLSFDYDKGILISRSSYFLDEEKDIFPETVEQIFTATMACLDYHYPAFMAVAFGGHPPARALKALESDEENEEPPKGQEESPINPTIRIQLPPKPKDEPNDPDD
jgi:hypothetical protein